MATTVYSNYGNAVAADPHRDGFKLYHVADSTEPYNGVREFWVWARSQKDAIVAAATSVGWGAYINRPGVTLEGP
jgi:hypothetical protein